MKKDLQFALIVLVVWAIVWMGVTILLDVVVFGDEMRFLRSLIPAIVSGLVFAIFTFVSRRKRKS